MAKSSGGRRNPAKTMSSTRLWLTVGGGVALLLMVGVGWSMLRSQAAAPAQATRVGSGQANAATAGGNSLPAPDFSVPTIEGGTFTLSAHRGKPVVLFVMAYWCGTCIPEAQALGRLHQKYGDRLTIIALDVDPSSTPERLQKFRQWAGETNYTWGFDSGQRVAQAYRVRALDTTFIINQAGEVVYTDAVPTSYPTLEEQIRKLLE